MTDIPIVMTSAGYVPPDPLTVRNTIIANATALAPGLTADLPGSLIEDVSSTDAAAVIQCDAALQELLNSLTPFGANLFILGQLGAIYGVQPGQNTNTSAIVQFSGTVGFFVPAGFVVTDGTYQYVVQDGGVVVSSLPLLTLEVIANVAGVWPVPPNSIDQLVTSLPPGVTLAVTNPEAGIPSPGPQSESDYRGQVLQAGLVAAQGMPLTVKSFLSAVPGVQPRLIAVQQQSPGWKIICGGGDPFSVAGAIFESMFDISNLVGSVIAITGITNANPGVVTTNLNHGLVTGQANVHIAGVVGMTGANGGPYTVTVITEKTFSFGVDTTGFGAYVSGGVVTPNARNITVAINDYPDTYDIEFVDPPQQTVAVQLTWATNSPYAVSAPAVHQLAGPAIQNYINSIPVGAPINEFELDAVFQTSIASIVAPQFIITLDWTISINGISTPPTVGTGAVYGDPESYFECFATGVTFTP